MGIELKTVRRKNGKERLYCYQVTYNGGRMRRKLLSGLDAWSAALDKFAGVDSTGGGKTSTIRLRWQCGQKPTIPHCLRPLLALCGYSVKDGKLCLRKGGQYYTPEAAAMRFSLLDPEAQAVAGSPERLQKASLRARSLLKRRNRMRTPTSFERCLADAFAELQ